MSSHANECVNFRFVLSVAMRRKQSAWPTDHAAETVSSTNGNFDFDQASNPPTMSSTFANPSCCKMLAAMDEAAVSKTALGFNWSWNMVTSLAGAAMLALVLTLGTADETLGRFSDVDVTARPGDPVGFVRRGR